MAPPPSPGTACRAALALCATSLLWSACTAQNTPSNAGDNAGPTPHAVSELWTAFRGDRAFADVQRQVECGPRPAGSAALEKAREHIENSLRQSGWSIERQAFNQSTPHGLKGMVNIVARFKLGAHRDPKAPPQPEPATPAGSRALVASHYDTKVFSTISFVGANDGASSTGALLELARVLALDPKLASRIDLVFFDGEEAVQQFSETDGLYGSRHFAGRLRDSGQNAQYRFAIVWDMIGDKNLNLTLPLDSPKELTREVLESARFLGVREKFGLLDRSLLDDHVPLQHVARIPTLDIIDFDYPAWHTADDTLHQISPESLQIVGSVTLHHLCTVLQPER